MMAVSNPLFKGIGSTYIYGSSPALDMGCYLKPNGMGEPKRILLVASGDIRHVFKTIGRLWREPHRQLEIYVYETQAPLLARFLLQFALIFGDSTLSLQERAEIFLEIYGNTFLRKKTQDLVVELAQDLTRFVTDEKNIDDKLVWAKAIDLQMLRFRDRDDIEFTLKFWRDQKKKFELDKLWENRLRSYYGLRYDARENVVDWDYHMKLKEMAEILNTKEFQRWREKGLAFEVRESQYSEPNRTLATVDGLKEDGLTVTKWGYFSDIIMGPFLAFGIECSENPKMFEKRNGMLMHNSQDVSEHNVKALLHEYLTQTEYTPDDVPMITNVEEADANAYRPLDHVKIHLLPCDFEQILKKRQFYGSFEVVYVSNSMAHRMQDLSKMLKNGGVLVAETAKFTLDLNKEQRLAYNEKLLEFANNANLRAQNTSGQNLVFHYDAKEE